MSFMSDEDFKDKMLTHIASTEKFQQKMTTAIFGDEDAKILGLAQRTVNNEDYIEKDKVFKNKVAGGLFLAVPVFGIIAEWVKKHILGM